MTISSPGRIAPGTIAGPGSTTYHWKKTGSPERSGFAGTGSATTPRPAVVVKTGAWTSEETTRKQPGMPKTPRSSGSGKPSQLVFEKPTFRTARVPPRARERWILKAAFPALVGVPPEVEIFGTTPVEPAQPGPKTVPFGGIPTKDATIARPAWLAPPGLANGAPATKSGTPSPFGSPAAAT